MFKKVSFAVSFKSFWSAFLLLMTMMMPARCMCCVCVCVWAKSKIVLSKCVCQRKNQPAERDPSFGASVCLHIESARTGTLCSEQCVCVCGRDGSASSSARVKTTRKDALSDELMMPEACSVLLLCVVDANFIFVMVPSCHCKKK